MPTPLHNNSSADLADEYGRLKAEIDARADRLDDLKAELVARANAGGLDRIEGRQVTVTIGKQTTTRLDTKALKAALGEAICAEYEKTSESIVVRIKPTLVFGQAA